VRTYSVIRALCVFFVVVVQYFLSRNKANSLIFFLLFFLIYFIFIFIFCDAAVFDCMPCELGYNYFHFLFFVVLCGNFQYVFGNYCVCIILFFLFFVVCM